MVCLIAGEGFEPPFPDPGSGVLPIRRSRTEVPSARTPCASELREEDSNLHFLIQSQTSCPLDDPAVQKDKSAGF
jgi:hypothetical protein